LTTVLTNESDQVCASLPDNVFSVSSPGPSCPGLDSDFDQVIQPDQVLNTEQVINTDQVIATDHPVINTSTQVHTSLQQSNLRSLPVSSPSDLPENPAEPAQSPLNNTRPLKTGRRRSGRSEPSHLEPKKIRLNNLNNSNENDQLSPNQGLPEASTNVHQL